MENEVKREFRDGQVFLETGHFERASVYTAGERIVSREEYLASPLPEEILDVRDCHVIPGLTDIHFHGCMGSDCCDGTEEAFRDREV